MLIDIRPADVFVKGSLAGAVSLPVDSAGTWEIFTAALKGKLREQPVHVMDRDGSLVAALPAEMEVCCLAGGYKAFQSWRQSVFATGPPIALIGGKTGSGKTELLHTLSRMGRQVIDLESLAQHKGSVFGSTPEKQPVPEAFQNQLLSAWLHLDAQVPVWMEEKGKSLGAVGIPEPLYERMTQAPMFALVTAFETRLRHIQEEYTGTDQKIFVASIKKLEKRMGFSANHKALHYHHSGQVEKCLGLLLAYYDQAYEEQRKTRSPQQMIPVKATVFSDEKELTRMEALVLAGKKEPRSLCRGEPNK